MTWRRAWWLVFAACAVAVIAALTWVTLQMHRLEDRESIARSEAAQQEAIRLALWRMDGWFAPRLARETARPYIDYEAFYAQPETYTTEYTKIDPGKVLTPSPLLQFRSEFIRLHFQSAPDGSIVSPQAPMGNERDLAEAGAYLDHAAIESNAQLLKRVVGMIPPAELERCAQLAQDAIMACSIEPPGVELPIAQTAQLDLEQSKKQQAGLNLVESSRRAQQYLDNAGMAQQSQSWLAPRAANGPQLTVGPFVPVWSDGPSGAELLYVRRVSVGDARFLQGFLCDWTKIRDAMLAEAADLTSGARLVPVASLDEISGAQSGRALASVPAVLEVPAPEPLPLAGAGAARLTLAITWCAVLVSLGLVAMTLYASIAHAERRDRFASAVTHELRTPLTTFRMYSEMLAQDMVRSPEDRQAYLRTLTDESDRLAALVENVLAYARLERGGTQVRPERVAIAALVETMRDTLRRPVERAGMTLEIEGIETADAEVIVDVEAVTQILLNLVENASKYARDGERVHLAVTVDGGRATFRVWDHGPGVPAAFARTVFAPFERGERSSGDPTSGVGLGLALARGLARRIGGDLALDPPAPPAGASFRLTLPLAN